MADPVIYMLHMLLYLNLRSKRHRRRFNGHLHDPIPIHGNFSLEVALERHVHATESSTEIEYSLWPIFRTAPISVQT